MTDGNWITIVSLGCAVMFFLGVPILLTIGYWIIGVSLVVNFTLANLGYTLFEGLNFFGLLALPLFILTGDLINGSGIARRMSDFAYSVLGWMRGGLAMASIGACGLFAAISGSNSATTASIGSIMHPEMTKAGYDPKFAAATVAAGGTVGIIIPPSVIFIVYGFLLNLSISDLFIAGIVPGFLMVAAMQTVAWWVSRRNGWGTLLKFEWGRVLKTGLGSWLGFFAIGLVLWGIYTGKFSPTEAAGVTVGFTIIVGLLMAPFYRQLHKGHSGDPEVKPIEQRSWGEMLLIPGFTFRGLPDVVMRSGQITGLLAPLIAISIVMQQVLSLIGAGDWVGAQLTGLGGGYYTILFAAMAIVLVSGCILESLPNTIIFAPILAPLAAAAGVNPIHFAVVFLIGDAIGFITPPYGLNLYVASGVTGIPYFQIVRRVMPYFYSLLFVWFAVAMIPQLSTMLLFQQGAGVFQK